MAIDRRCFSGNCCYGADAYDFAKGKPLTLLNGSNLLYLLKKHGHHAKIDLKEAKRILSEREL
jgi:restriction system protein